MKDYKIKIELIRNNLYNEGRRGQHKDLIKLMLDNEDIRSDDVLSDITQLLSERKQLLEEDLYIAN